MINAILTIIAYFVVCFLAGYGAGVITGVNALVAACIASSLAVCWFIYQGVQVLREQARHARAIQKWADAAERAKGPPGPKTVQRES